MEHGNHVRIAGDYPRVQVRIPINRSLGAQALVEGIGISQNLRIQELIQTESWGRFAFGGGSHSLLMLIFQFPFVISHSPFGYWLSLEFLVNHGPGWSQSMANEKWKMRNGKCLRLYASNRRTSSSLIASTRAITSRSISSDSCSMVGASNSVRSANSTPNTPRI